MRGSWRWLPGLMLLGSTAASAPSPVGGDGRGEGSDDGDDLIAVEGRDGGIELEMLLALAADVTGEPFFFDPAALHGLRARPIEAKAIPRKRLLAYLDDQLREADCVVVERVVAGVRCHRVVSFHSPSRVHSDLKTAAEVVTPDELASIADEWSSARRWQKEWLMPKASPFERSVSVVLTIVHRSASAARRSGGTYSAPSRTLGVRAASRDATTEWTRTPATTDSNVVKSNSRS